MRKWISWLKIQHTSIMAVLMVMVVVAGGVNAATAVLKGQNQLVPGIDHYRLLVKFRTTAVQDITDQQLVFSSTPPAATRVAIQSAQQLIPNYTYQQVVRFTAEEKQNLLQGQVPPAAPGQFDYFAYRGMAYVLEAETMSAAEVLKLAQQFEQLAIVEYVALEPLQPIAPPSTTPLLTQHQDYRYAQHPTVANVIGIDAEYAWSQGIFGQGVQVADIEWGFNYQHEDLASDKFIELISTTNHSEDDHGTAVAGIMFAQENTFGMKGMVHGVDKFYGISEIRYGRVSGILEGLKNLKAGDVFLYEMQTPGRNNKFVPADFNQAVWDVTKSATDAGVIVVAAAGNGGELLDHYFYDAYRARGDNGSIIVGAGKRIGRERASFSTYGTPVHVQGWGDWSVATTGYGNLYNGGENATYTQGFSGTSAATPIVASAIIAIQSWSKRELNRTLMPREMRALLIETGTPQVGDQHIGPLPNIKNAIEHLMQSRFVDQADGTVHDAKTGLIWSRCSLGQSWQQGRCTGEATLLTLPNANEQAAAANVANQSDWRLPTVNELKTLVVCSSNLPARWKDSHEACAGDYLSPTIDPAIFPDQARIAVWSSSAYMGSMTQGWVVNFNQGEVLPTASGSALHSVRLVRGTSPSTIQVPDEVVSSALTSQSAQIQWQPVSGALGYRIRVATDRAFNQLLPGYQHLDVGQVTTVQLTQLTAETDYFVQVQSYDATAVSDFSAPLALTTAGLPSYQVSAVAGAGGTVTPALQQVVQGATTTVTLTPLPGFQIATATGCGGVLQGQRYTTAAVTTHCQILVSFSVLFDINLRYQVVGSGGTVRDLVTGLEWQRCSMGQVWNGSRCDGAAGQVTWLAAGNLVAPAGYRLPTSLELASLTYCSNLAATKSVQDIASCGEMGQFQQPTIYLPIFPDTPAGLFWSGTTAQTGQANYVSLFDGHQASALSTEMLHVRFVRTITEPKKRKTNRLILLLGSIQQAK